MSTGDSLVVGTLYLHRSLQTRSPAAGDSVENARVQCKVFLQEHGSGWVGRVKVAQLSRVVRFGELLLAPCLERRRRRVCVCLCVRAGSNSQPLGPPPVRSVYRLELFAQIGLRKPVCAKKLNIKFPFTYSVRLVQYCGIVHALKSI